LYSLYLQHYHIFAKSLPRLNHSIHFSNLDHREDNGAVHHNIHIPDPWLHWNVCHFFVEHLEFWLVKNLTYSHNKPPRMARVCSHRDSNWAGIYFLFG
jgi:hypothetical protein